MSRDKAIGGGLLALSVVVIIVYIWLVFFPPLAGADIFLLKLTGAVAVVVVFAIIGWIGYTLATTPPPKPIEEIEKELEEELKKIEKETGTVTEGETKQDQQST
ncbi:MAG: transcriptional regulator [Candidatus Nezhaarchaeales archaeon]